MTEYMFYHLRRKVNELEEENKRLKAENELLKGKVEALQDGTAASEKTREKVDKI